MNVSLLAPVALWRGKTYQGDLPRSSERGLIAKQCARCWKFVLDNPFHRTALAWGCFSFGLTEAVPLIDTRMLQLGEFLFRPFFSHNKPKLKLPKLKRSGIYGYERAVIRSKLKHPKLKPEGIDRFFDTLSTDN